MPMMATPERRAVTLVLLLRRALVARDCRIPVLRRLAGLVQVVPVVRGRLVLAVPEALVAVKLVRAVLVAQAVPVKLAGPLLLVALLASVER